MIIPLLADKEVICFAVKCREPSHIKKPRINLSLLAEISKGWGVTHDVSDLINLGDVWLQPPVHNDPNYNYHISYKTVVK